MKTITYTILILLLSLSNYMSAQQFWLTTKEFWGGPKTGITIIQDSVFIVSTSNAVLKSTDELESIEEVLAASDISTVFASKEGKIFAGGSGKIFLSDDMGNNWDSVSINSIYPVIQFTENSSGVLFAITNDLDDGDGVFCSGDKGMTWEKRNNGLGTHLGCSKIAVDKNDRLYIAISDEKSVGFGGLYISDNNGLSWEKVKIEVDSLSNPIKIGITTGLSILSNDSIYYSFYGIANNFLIKLNIYRSIENINTDYSWNVLQLKKFQHWWEDMTLNNIYKSKKGDWYSSTSGRVSHAGTCFSKDGVNWEILDYGLGTDVSGGRSNQVFTETVGGKIFMIQMLDEKIYTTSNSVLTNVPDLYEFEPEILIYPNPVRKGEILTVQAYKFRGVTSITVHDLTGKTLLSASTHQDHAELNIPFEKGVYIVSVQYGHTRKATSLVVY